MDLLTALASALFDQDLWIGLLAVTMLALFTIDLASFWLPGFHHKDYKAVITGIGMLGTFSGVFIGLINFDASSPEKITASVPLLLEGLKYAFATSIGGLTLALLLHIIQSLTGKGIPAMMEKDLLQQITEQTQVLPVIAEHTGQLQAITLLLQQQQAVLTQIHNDLYQQRRRFSKLDEQAKVLPKSAPAWAAIRDSETGLVWEYKTPETGSHYCGQRFDWEKAQQFVQQNNQAEWLGFSDWRFPTLAELQFLLSLPQGADPQFFGLMDDPLQPDPKIFSDDGLAVVRPAGQPAPATQAHVVLVRGENLATVTK